MYPDLGGDGGVDGLPQDAVCCGGGEDGPLEAHLDVQVPPHLVAHVVCVHRVDVDGEDHQVSVDGNHLLALQNCEAALDEVPSKSLYTS